jgi:hypothetical protein
MARATSGKVSEKLTGFWSSPALQKQIVMGAAAAAAVILMAVFGFYRLEQFLIRDARFAANTAESEAGAVSLHVRGVNYSSRRLIESMFAEDMGRSIYLLPLPDRRLSLRSIDWVKDASVGRAWPNQILVRITERKPVAFVMKPPSGTYLIDDEGVMMQPVKGPHFHLPVLKGIRKADSVPQKREKVQTMLRLLREIGDGADLVSEVDTSDSENLKITQPWEGRSVTLLMGDQNFSVRYRNFTSHIAEIRKSLPHTSVLDLRLENQITAADN